MSSFFSQCGHRARRAVSFHMQSGCGALGLALFACVFVGSFSITGHAGRSRTVEDGVYTSAQAARGQAVFKDQCVICHGETLKGSLGPPLAGDEFIAVWGNQPLSDLVNRIQQTMPENDPGKLTRQQAVDLVAHILQVGEFPAGRAELGSDEAGLKGITFPAPAPRAGKAAHKASQTRNHMAVDEVGSVGAYPATMSIATNPVERPQARPAEQPNVLDDRVVFAGA